MGTCAATTPCPSALCPAPQPRASSGFRLLYSSSTLPASAPRRSTAEMLPLTRSLGRSPPLRRMALHVGAAPAGCPGEDRAGVRGRATVRARPAQASAAGG